MLDEAFDQVLSGANYQVVALPHPWFTLLVQNVDGRGALLIRVALAPDKVIGDGRGFSVVVERNGRDDFVRVSSSEKGAPPVFRKLVHHIVEQTSGAPSVDQAIEALLQAVYQFRQFSARRGGRLSEDEVRGLVAELSLLQILIASGASIDSVVAAWKGPFAKSGIGVHDFTFSSGRGIEVKSTHQPLQEIRVSSPTQLVPSQQLELDLVVLPLEAVTPGSEVGFAFRELVVGTSAIVDKASVSAQETWRDALDAMGLDISDGYYDQWHFLAGNWVRFQVREGFPSIAAEALPEGVVKVTYSLELQHLAVFSESFADLVERGAN